MSAIYNAVGVRSVYYVVVEKVYFVTKKDEPTGEVSEKLEAHHSDTKLHAAFSCYVFNEKGEFLVTQRANSKKVWPCVWTNSCCGHPAPGESREDAIMRRMQEELGMTVENIQLVLPNYVYKTPPFKGIIEHEYCPLYVATATSGIKPNPEEVKDYKWVRWEWFLGQASADDSDYTDPASLEAPKWSWWCKDQVKLLKENKRFTDLLTAMNETSV